MKRKILYFDCETTGTDSRRHDIIQLDYMGEICLPNYKLATICAHYGIAIEAHDAMSDIEATRELIYKVVLTEKEKI